MGRAQSRRRRIWAIGGFLFTLAAGAALRFLWVWTGQSHLAAAFSAVNSSVWEHMKILFFPLFLLSMVQVWMQDSSNFLAVRALSVLAGTALIPALFYTYTGALGVRTPWGDAAVFVLAAAVTFAMDLSLRRQGRCSSGWQQVAGLAALWALALLFVLWTYRPPQLALFQPLPTAVPITANVNNL